MVVVALTSTFGTLLKIDSKKKVCNKLQGACANLESWTTESESALALQPMEDALVDTAEQASSSIVL